jgi:hypothetical protein
MANPDSNQLATAALKIGSEHERGGLDQLARYQTFRDGNGWGIHIRRHGVVGMAHHLHVESGMSVRRSIKAAFRCLYEHELFHFQVDCAYLKLETAGRTSVPQSSIFGPNSLYRHSRSLFATWDPLEEALANACAFREAKPEFQGALRTFLREGPFGYKDFEHFLPKRKFDNALHGLFNLTEKSIGREGLSSGVGSLIDLKDKGLNGAHVPTYLVLD